MTSHIILEVLQLRYSFNVSVYHARRLMKISCIDFLTRAIFLFLSSHKSLTYLQRIVNSSLCGLKTSCNFTYHDTLSARCSHQRFSLSSQFSATTIFTQCCRYTLLDSCLLMPHFLPIHFTLLNFVFFSFFNGLQHTSVHFKVHNSV